MSDKDRYDWDMLICPHCKKAIKFRTELIDGLSPSIDKVRKTTKTEFNLIDDGI